MEKITPPRVRVLATGQKLITKMMEADPGALLPRHYADLESVVFVHEGKINLQLGSEDIELSAGEAHTIPPDVTHQIRAITAFKGVHLMPNEIKFTFLR